MQAEAKALARAVNATVYSPEMLSTRYGSSPFKVLARAFKILSLIGIFGFKVWVDQLQGRVDERRRLRAVELRNVLTGLGPTFVKIGQGLSTRPDLCPPEYLEELSELQVVSPFRICLSFCKFVKMGIFNFLFVVIVVIIVLLMFRLIL